MAPPEKRDKFKRRYRLEKPHDTAARLKHEQLKKSF